MIGAYALTNGAFRSLLVGVYRGNHFVYVGRVGTGYGAKVVDQILPKLKALESSNSPSTGIGAPRSPPILFGSSRNWLPKSSLLAGPPTGR